MTVELTHVRLLKPEDYMNPTERQIYFERHGRFPRVTRSGYEQDGASWLRSQYWRWSGRTW